MGYSIFSNTMVDMTFPQIEEAINQGTSVLFPISVVEEHGPHLCTGTDIYLTQNVCEKIKHKLEEWGENILISPPYFWGINSITNGFTGSFSVSPELMEAIILEVIMNLKNWGVPKIFLLSFHGDYQNIHHVAAIAKKATLDLGIDTVFIVSEDVYTQFGLSPYSPYVLTTKIDTATVKHDYIDIHAGADETNWLLLNYPDLVDVDTAQHLPNTNLTFSELKQWLNGGQIAKSITPLGYLGHPSDTNLKEIQQYEYMMVNSFAETIFNQIR